MTDDPHLLATSWQVRFKHLKDTLLNTIFPPVCAHCQKVGSLLCADCVASLPHLREPLCGRCGRVTSESSHLCSQCQHQPPLLHQMRATFQFTDPVPGIIHKLKYQGQFALAKPLGELMAESWPSWRAPAELVMSIPLHPKRKKYRGYNQSELLARHLCHALDLPGDSRALRRMRNTRPQIDLSPTDRVTNVAGAFWADGEKVAGKAILLIDDVCTTGSTLSEAAKALLTAGATTVSAYCLARVVEE